MSDKPETPALPGFFYGVKGMANKKDKRIAGSVLVLMGTLVFLPFLIFSLLHYQKLKRRFAAIPNTQRVYDAGKLAKTVGVAVVFIGFAISPCLVLSIVINRIAAPDVAVWAMPALIAVIALAIVWPLKKLAERVAVNYFGVVFNDNDGSLLLPADIYNLSAGDILRLRFLHYAGDQERIEIKKITRLTREKGIHFYIHGDFGSRKITFSNKQKRDECMSALQARSRTKSGGDAG